MSITKHQQRGLAGSATVLLIVIIIFSLWVFFKLFPFYMENAKVTNVLETIQTTPEALQKSNDELRRMVLDGFSNKDLKRINQDNFDSYVKISKEATGFEITVKYDQTVPIASNLYFLNKFEKTVVATPAR
jgi:hypothetical protein